MRTLQCARNERAASAQPHSKRVGIKRMKNVRGFGRARDGRDRLSLRLQVREQNLDTTFGRHGVMGMRDRNELWRKARRDRRGTQAPETRSRVWPFHPCRLTRAAHDATIQNHRRVCCVLSSSSSLLSGCVSFSLLLARPFSLSSFNFNALQFLFDFFSSFFSCSLHISEFGHF